MTSPRDRRAAGAAQKRGAGAERTGPRASKRGTATGRSGYAAIVGHTNVGKSTLFNRFLGEKIAIVAEVPQTTRTRITGILTLPEGQVVFVDTPGFHRPQHRMNRAMVRTARDALAGVDVLIWVADAAVGFGAGDLEVARLLAERRGRARVFLALNKIDRVRKPALLPLLDRAARELGVDEAFPLSARSGENCDALLRAVVAALPEGPRLFPEDALTDQPERVIAAELIREKILRHTREEVPHAVAVTIEAWEDGEDGLARIHAAILVEREGQKGIVIGKGGEMLKRVGTEARGEIERLIGRRVGLKLWVRVRAHWRDDAGALHELGIE